MIMMSLTKDRDPVTVYLHSVTLISLTFPSSTIGEKAGLDNLEPTAVAESVCLSRQGLLSST